MNLVPSKPGQAHPAHEHGEHDRHAGHKTSSLLTKFWIALALTVPIFFASEMAHMVFGLETPRFFGSAVVFLGLGTIVYFYCGWIFLASAYRELRAKLPGMMTLIAMAITAAYAYSLFAILTGSGHDLLFELASLITIMLLGHWIEMKSVQGAQGALKALAKLLPDQAEVIRGERTQTIALSDLRVGDVVLVRPGARVPADGRVMEGQSDVNESIITGESRPISKAVGAMVIAGSVNGDGSLKVTIEKIGEHTFLAGIMRLVAEAQTSKSHLQMLSDRAAFYLTIVAIGVGSLTFVTWLVLGAGLVTATERLVAVLVITCPHALGLAVPLVASISTTLAARNGLLVRQRLALESARQIDTVVFDKTGTLTKGEFGVDTIVVAGQATEDEVLTAAAGVNSQSQHPLARAMTRAAAERGLALPTISEFMSYPGQGASAKLDGAVVFVGNEQLLKGKVVIISPEHQQAVTRLSKQGKTVIHVVRGQQLLGSLALVDVIREESQQAVQALQKLGIKTIMLTGDSEDVAAWVTQKIGLDEYVAKVMPGQKAEKVKMLQAKGRHVAMVGDGVNDAPGLTQADLGIAIGAGTNVAIESAGIILVKSDPRDIPKIFRLSRLTYNKMIQNLFWATGYNVIAIPLAAGVLASQGLVLEPWLAAVFMSVSTVIVAVNAMLLRRKTLEF